MLNRKEAKWQIFLMNCLAETWLSLRFPFLSEQHIISNTTWSSNTRWNINRAGGCKLMNSNKGGNGYSDAQIDSRKHRRMDTRTDPWTSDRQMNRQTASVKVDKVMATYISEKNLRSQCKLCVSNRICSFPHYGKLFKDWPSALAHDMQWRDVWLHEKLQCLWNGEECSCLVTLQAHAH